MLGYNRMTGYNKARYNAEGTELFASDTMSISDNTLAKEMRKSFAESIFQADNIPSRSITGRILDDEIRLADWFIIDKNPSEPWSD